MRRIALAGRAGAGKDSVADILCRGNGFTRYEFARPLKAMLAVIGVDCNTRETKELPHPLFGKSPRVMAQRLGTEWMREMIHPEGWLILAGQFIDQHRARNIVVTDCRYENELSYLRARSFELWHVDRPNLPQVAAHSSEVPLARMPGDTVILNSGTLGSLAWVVDHALL